MIRRIAVCDDDKMILRQLSQYLTQLQQETEMEFDVFYYKSAEELLAHMPRDVQVLLLDIAMKDISGMEAARHLRAEGFSAAIFFITSMTEYALEGYGVRAFAFLSKPILYAELRQALTEYFSQLDQPRQAILAIDRAGGTELLAMEDILYAEVFQHETIFTLKQRQITGNIQLGEVEKRLSAYGFFRCHRCYLVGFPHIVRIDPNTLIMSNGTVIPISRYRRKAFLDAYTLYMGVML